MNSKQFQINTKKYKGFAYIWSGSSMMILKSIDASMHKHYPFEIYLGLEEPFELYIDDKWHKFKAVIIESNHPHKFKGGKGWQALLLLDPLNPMIFSLRKKLLKEKKFCELDNMAVITYAEKIRDFLSSGNETLDAELLFTEFISSIYTVDELNHSIDSRINKVLTMLNENSENLISAKNLAETVGLSESRLAHLFKGQTGITIRRYLMWLRLTKVVNLVISGLSLTDAAHEAGFADSAHFSRTYRQIFGLSPTDILKKPAD